MSKSLQVFPWSLRQCRRDLWEKIRKQGKDSGNDCRTKGSTDTLVTITHHPQDPPLFLPLEISNYMHNQDNVSDVPIWTQG